MKILENLRPYLLGTGELEEKKAARVAVLMLFLGSLAGLWPAFLNRVLFDRVVPDRDRRLILPVLLVAISCELLSLRCRYDAERHLAGISRRGRFVERNRQASFLWGCKPEWFDVQGEGSAVKFNDDAGVLGDLRSCFIRSIIGPLMAIALFLPPLILICPLLAWSRLVLSVLTLSTGSLFLRKDLSLERELWCLRRNLNSLLTQGSRGIRTLRIYGGCGDFVRQLRFRFFQLGFRERERDILSARWQAWAMGFSRLGSAASPALAVFLIISGNLSFGSFIAFSIIAGRGLGAVGDLFSGLRIMARAGNAAARRDLLISASRKPFRTGIGIGIAAERAGSGLEVRNLSYAYPQNKGIETRSLLHNLCFQAGSGEWIMLSGDNGSGKSTLFFLIHGLLQPDAGCIEWNGTALDAYSPHQRLAVVGGVLQSPAFFDATVRENLTLFSPSPGETSIERALSYADAADTVAALPRGLDTRLQGGGANLSGGARQRLALARLFLNPPPLILLDEPFTALDSLSIQRVAEGMRNLASDRTLLLVHHGSSLPVSVDRTLNLQDGQIT